MVVIAAPILTVKFKSLATPTTPKYLFTFDGNIISPTPVLNAIPDNLTTLEVVNP